jgi:hypothetical protein
MVPRWPKLVLLARGIIVSSALAVTVRGEYDAQCVEAKEKTALVTAAMSIVECVTDLENS